MGSDTNKTSTKHSRKLINKTYLADWKNGEDRLLAKLIKKRKNKTEAHKIYIGLLNNMGVMGTNFRTLKNPSITFDSSKT